ncbi:MAG: hypothetical protein ABIR14_01050, partial [Candidatus Paceibacterota bacterium]
MKTILKVSSFVLVFGFMSFGLFNFTHAEDVVAADLTSFEPMTLTVVNNVVGGTAASADFTITVTGGNATPGSFAGSDTPGTDVSVDAVSAYTVLASGPTNYTTDYSPDCNTTSVNNFHPKTCTVTNTFVTPPAECQNLPATGTVTEGNATLTVPEGACPIEVSFSSYDLPGGSMLPYENQILKDNITSTYEPGTYVIGPLELACNWQTDLYTGPVQEHLLPGAGHDQTNSLFITYDFAENQICTPNPAHLNVIKHVIGGTKVAANFQITVTGAGALPATFAGSETGTDVALTPASTYSVVEGAHDGYNVSYSEGCNGTSINEFHPSTCTITNTVILNPTDTPPTTIRTTKVICNAETDLPNWSGTNMTITGSTATDYVASHPNCHLAPDWQFQVRYWGPSDNPNLNLSANTQDPGGSFVGEAETPWTTISGVTNANGVLTTTFDPNNVWHFWVREVLKDGYIPFGGETGNLPGSDVSAEMYCHTDVLNYDNFERVDGPFTGGETFNCVAFNVPKVIIDVCPNIEGNQSIIPDDQHLDDEGNCVDDEITTRRHRSGGGSSGGRAAPVGEVLGAEAPIAPQV